jgi:hypothetical protein
MVNLNTARFPQFSQKHYSLLQNFLYLDVDLQLRETIRKAVAPAFHNFCFFAYINLKKNLRLKLSS